MKKTLTLGLLIVFLATTVGSAQATDDTLKPIDQAQKQGVRKNRKVHKGAAKRVHKKQKATPEKAAEPVSVQ